MVHDVASDVGLAVVHAYKSVNRPLNKTYYRVSQYTSRHIRVALNRDLHVKQNTARHNRRHSSTLIGQFPASRAKCLPP